MSHGLFLLPNVLLLDVSEKEEVVVVVVVVVRWWGGGGGGGGEGIKRGKHGK